MEEKIYKVTSIDLGSTNSQMTQTYIKSMDGRKTWEILNEPGNEVHYFIKDNGMINIPTILVRKNDLDDSQKMFFGEMNQEYLAGCEAKKMYKSHYALKVISEFKKDFFCSDEAKEDAEAKKRYDLAQKAILQFLTFLKKRESAEEQKYAEAIEKTILTVPVRATSTERDNMEKLALEAGWKNVETQDEARSVLRYAIGKKNSVLVHKLSQMTLIQDFYVLIIDIGGSTTDLLLVKIRPDGKGWIMDPDIVEQWPAIGEKEALGNIDIDKKLCNWFLENGFILPELTEQEIQNRGYALFREFKETYMTMIKNGDEIEQLIGDIINLTCDRKKRKWSENSYDDSTKKLNQDIFLKEIASEYLMKIQTAIRDLMKEACVCEQDLDCIITAGGGTNMYGIKEMLLGKLDLPEPLRFSKIQANTEMYIEGSENPSAVCALGNVMPMPNISFKNHALTDFVMKVRIYNVSTEQSRSEWQTTHSDRPKIPKGFKQVYYKRYEILKKGVTLPQSKVVEESFSVFSNPKSAYVYVIEIFSQKQGKLFFQRAWSDYSCRTLGTVVNDWIKGKDNFEVKDANYTIQLDFNENYKISIDAKFHIDGNWGLFRRKETVNG